MRAKLFAGAVLGAGLLVSGGFGQSKPASSKPAPSKPAPAAAASSFDKVAFEDYLRNLYVWGPQIEVKVGDPVPSTKLSGMREVQVKASQGPRASEFTYFLTADGKRFFRTDVSDLTVDPFQADREKLKTEFQPSFGTPGAPVIIVEFSDFQCGYCREEAKQIRANLLKTYPKEVRFYFKDYPLEQIHDWAKPAALAGRCVFRQNPTSFWDFHDWIFENQPSITAANLKTKIGEFAAQKNIDTLQLNKCIETKATEAEVGKNQAEGKELSVNSTPTLFINGRRIASAVAWDDLKYIIDFELDRAKKSGKKGEESCCTTELPSIVPK